MMGARSVGGGAVERKPGPTGWPACSLRFHFWLCRWQWPNGLRLSRRDLYPDIMTENERPNCGPLFRWRHVLRWIKRLTLNHYRHQAGACTRLMPLIFLPESGVADRNGDSVGCFAAHPTFALHSQKQLWGDGRVITYFPIGARMDTAYARA